MRSIDPNLFTRLMRLPASHRLDILEFLGSSHLADIQVSDLIEKVSALPNQERILGFDPGGDYRRQ